MKKLMRASQINLWRISRKAASNFAQATGVSARTAYRMWGIVTNYSWAETLVALWQLLISPTGLWHLSNCTMRQCQSKGYSLRQRHCLTLHRGRVKAFFSQLATHGCEGMIILCLVALHRLQTIRLICLQRRWAISTTPLLDIPPPGAILDSQGQTQPGGPHGRCPFHSELHPRAHCG